MLLLALFVLTGCNTKKNVIEVKFLDIPISEITGTVSFISETVDDIEIEIIAVTASDGAVRIAFNRCERCYKSGKGFIQKDSDLICQQCSMPFNIDKIGIEHGECVPIPIPVKEKLVTENLIKISHNTLKNYTQWFIISEPEQIEQTDQ